MLISTIIMAVLSLILFIVAYFQGNGSHIQGVKVGWNLTLQVMPMILIAFIIAGLLQTLIPKDQINGLIGDESGLKGIIIGSIAGAFTFGGPYVSYPIAAGLYKSGAGIGTIVAFISGWSLWSFGRLPLEIGVMGWHFTLVRYASVCLLPPLSGLIALYLSRVFN